MPRKKIQEQKLPRMKGVKSSNVRSIGYDEDFEELYVRFKSGGFYVYYGVDEDEYDMFINSGSKGKYLYHSIRDFYNYSKLN